MYMYANARTDISGCIIHEHVLVCTSKSIWAELSYEFGPSCFITLGGVGMSRVLFGPSWHWPSLGLLRVSEYSDIRGSEYKIEYEYSSLPKSLDRDLFFFFFFGLFCY